jgi:50S ribosomal subunit-associated GTPase HflX
VVGSTYQALESPNPASYIGSGKVAEVTAAVRAYGVETVIFDDELSPGGCAGVQRGWLECQLQVSAEVWSASTAVPKRCPSCGDVQ